MSIIHASRSITSSIPIGRLQVMHTRAPRVFTVLQYGHWCTSSGASFAVSAFF
jgi:hypothetical protein